MDHRQFLRTLGHRPAIRKLRAATALSVQRAADGVQHSAGSDGAQRSAGSRRRSALSGRERRPWSPPGRIAYASAKEVDSHLRLLAATGAISSSAATAALDRFDQVRAMIWRLLNPQP